MNPLRTLENAIAGLVEGAFGRVFKTEVRPMELAHKLAREMDENRTASVSKVYVPNEYSVWLSPRDRARYEGVEREVIDELCAYLLEHARAEGFALASAPQIAFHTDEDLQLGEFGIEARMAKVEEQRDERRRPPRDRERASGAGPAAAAPGLRAPASTRPASAAPPPAAPGPLGAPVPAAGEPEPEGAGNTMIVSTSQRTREAFEQAGSRRRAKALLVVGGRRLVVPPRGATIGRSRDCDIVLEDSGVSRRHAELRPLAAASWTIEDLGSTNGLRVNGRRVNGAHELHSGDTVGVGSTEMVFEIST